jgi:flagellar FliJ protein
MTLLMWLNSQAGANSQLPYQKLRQILLQSGDALPGINCFERNCLQTKDYGPTRHVSWSRGLQTIMIETVNSHQNQRFEYDEKRQQVNDLEMMIADFRRMANDLDQQIKIEQQASGISDVNHFAYPTFARAAISRRDNLKSSISELEKRLDRGRQEALEAFEQLKLSESAGELEAQRQVKPTARRKPPRHIASLAGSR